MLFHSHNFSKILKKIKLSKSFLSPFEVIDAPHTTHLVWTRKFELQGSFWDFFENTQVRGCSPQKMHRKDNAYRCMHSQNSELGTVWVCLATSCAEIKDCDSYKGDATWYRLLVVSTCYLLNLTYNYNFEISTNMPRYKF